MKIERGTITYIGRVQKPKSPTEILFFSINLFCKIRFKINSSAYASRIDTKSQKEG